MAKQSGRYAYMVHTISGLTAMGGAAKPQEVYDWLQREGHALAEDLTTIQKDGGTRFRKEVRWARKELFDAGLLDTSSDGRWALTELGARGPLTIAQAQAIVRARTQLRRHGGDQPSIPSLDASRAGRELDDARATTGPTPSDWTGVVSRSVDLPAFTYVAQFGERDIWKVGFSGSLEGRLADLNRHVPYEVLGERWAMRWSRLWPNASLAYQSEQALLAALMARRTTGERLCCESTEIEVVWKRVVG